MRIVCLSDTHNMGDRLSVPDGDVLVHAGDLTGRGKEAEIVAANRWLGTLPHKHKLITAGNHDFAFETNPKEARALITNATYLQDEAFIIDGLKFYFSPWQPWFHDWAFNLPRGEPLKKKWDMIQEGTHILVTHGPPFGILDQTSTGERVGCEELMLAVQRVKPLLHVVGHIHEGYGYKERDGTTFVNASNCTLAYKPTNPPIVVDIEKKEDKWAVVSIAQN